MFRDGSRSLLFASFGTSASFELKVAFHGGGRPNVKKAEKKKKEMQKHITDFQCKNSQIDKSKLISIPQVSAVEKKLVEFIGKLDASSPKTALNGLLMGCSVENLNMALAEMDKDTATSNNPDAKLVKVSHYIFGQELQDVLSIKTSLDAVVKSCELSVQRAFAACIVEDTSFNEGNLAQMVGVCKAFLSGKADASTEAEL